MQREFEPEVMDTSEETDAYDSMDHSRENAAFVARLVELGAHGSMLDIGTGPGHIPLLLCEQIPSARVLGVDLAHTMLDRAQEHLAASRFADRIKFRIGDAKALDIPDACFDTVFSNTILHHIPDPLCLLSEARRVLRPGGVLLIRDLFRPATAERALELVKLHAADATPDQRELFRASLHAALTVEELRDLAVAADLDDAEIVVDSDRHMSLQRRASP